MEGSTGGTLPMRGTHISNSIGNLRYTDTCVGAFDPSQQMQLNWCGRTAITSSAPRLAAPLLANKIKFLVAGSGKIHQLNVGNKR